MIPKVNSQGDRTIGLLSYLYGPGKREEHIDPHLVASFDGLAPDPGRDPAVTLKELQLLLDQPVQALEKELRPAHHVWHCSVRADPGDRILTDQEWGDIARRIVAATGIDPDNDGAGCRWVAVRHAEDHIHIVATLVREDGHKPDHHRSGKRAQAECRLVETEYGLVRVNAGDGTAAKRPTSAEKHKAERHGRQQTPREELRESVRHAVAGAASQREFFDRLTVAGLLVRTRVAPSGDLLGYTVALPGDRNGNGEPVFYSGSSLAPDLSLPRIRARFTTGIGESEAADRRDCDQPRTGRADIGRARHAAADAVWASALDLGEDDDGAAAAQLSAAQEVLDALATTTTGPTRTELVAAAREFERSGRSHVRARHAQARALRRAAREVVFAGPSLGRGEDGAAAAMVLSSLIFLVVAAARWHAQREHAQQAAAAFRTAGHLRAAYRTASQAPMAALRGRGRQLPAQTRSRHARLVQSALPEQAQTVLGESGWQALAATLADAEAAGHDPATLLKEAAGRRELESAESVSEVLVWRMRHLASLPAPTPAVNRRPRSGALVAPTAQAVSAGERHRQGPSGR